MKFIWILLAALMLCGCSASTVDQMYALPKRSEDYSNFRLVVERAMGDLEYCAPLAGENQQSVQMADLDGDSVPEYLVFAKGDAEKPLKILIFRAEGSSYHLIQTIESNGTAFDQVEYVQMDGEAGVELIVGSQLSDDMLRSVAVYANPNGSMEQIMTSSYSKFLTCDLDGNGLQEMLLIRPGQTEADKGIAELFLIRDGLLERSNEVSMSESADRLKRIIKGNLSGGRSAVYVASAVGEDAIITDVFAVINGVFSNVSFSNDSGTSVKTLRNYYVYAEDIDSDGVVELPDLIPMVPVDEEKSGLQHNVIRWYAMTQTGAERNKLYTFHNYTQGWYLELEKAAAPFLSVRQSGQDCEFYLWNSSYTQARKVLTISVTSVNAKQSFSDTETAFEIYRNDNFVYTAVLEEAGFEIFADKELLIASFHMIHRDWNTGET